MAQELIQISSKHPLTRIVLIIVIGACAMGCSFAIRWYLGNTLAEYLDNGEDSINTAKLASSLSPNDPLPHWRLGQVYHEKLSLDQTAVIAAEYEKAVSLSPNDYRYWMSFGTALEQSGDADRGAKALRQAIALAPAYAMPHWYLGNLLLRNGRYAEAFSELRLAAAADDQLRPQLYRLAIEVYDGDIAGLTSAIGDTASARANLAMYLLQIQRVPVGLSLWDSLSEADKKANAAPANSIIGSLVGLYRYHDAMKIWNSIAPGDNLKTDLGRITDGDFEQMISESPFGWQVQTVPQMQIGIDPEVAHSGERSLRLTFQVRTSIPYISAFTLVPVAKATEYNFECFVKTQKLQGADTPYIVILNAADNALLANSSQAVQGDSDWTRVSLSFKTGEKSEAVRIHLARNACEKDKICPLFGAVWYDDFSLNRPR